MFDQNDFYQPIAMATVTGTCWAQEIYSSYLPDGKLWKCYSARFVYFDNGTYRDVDKIVKGSSTATLSYGYYGYNSWGFGSIAGKATTVTEEKWRAIKGAGVRSPSSKILIGDTARRLDDTRTGNPSYANYAVLTWSTLYTLTAGHGTLDSRHNGTANIGRADGHVSSELDATKHFRYYGAGDELTQFSNAMRHWFNPYHSE